MRTPARLGGVAALVLAVVLAQPLAGAGAATATRPGFAPPKPASTVLAWGSNSYGELGNGTTTDSDNPAPVRLGNGYQFSTVRCLLYGLAVTTSGKVFSWGDNATGELGDGTTKRRLTPVRVDLPAGVKVTTVRAGGGFALALTAGGQLLTWGSGYDGELGTGSTTSRLKPVKVDVPKGVVIRAISAGDDFGLALTRAGRVLSWGGGGGGQLGDGSVKNRLKPGYVTLPAHTTVTSVAAGSQVAFATTSAGALLAWGFNQDGQLGDGTTKERNTPVRVRLPAGVKVAAATVGLLHALALTTGGRVLAWGSNQLGQLGDGTTTDRHTPVFVKLPAGDKVGELAAGKYVSVALTTAHQVLAWGTNSSGELGGASVGQSDLPLEVQLPAYKVTGIGAGFGASTILAIAQQLPV
jgi:alpha-tubulin suppressor-like RCC1 family protein